MLHLIIDSTLHLGALHFGAETALRRMLDLDLIGLVEYGDLIIDSR